MTDPISDMFIRLKNAQKAGHATIRIPFSRFKYEIARSLSRAGLVGSVERKGKRVKKFFEVELLYHDGAAAVQGVRMLSTPSRRLYSSLKSATFSPHGGTIILSTPRGVMSGAEAKKERVGGALIAEVW